MILRGIFRKPKNKKVSIDLHFMPYAHGESSGIPKLFNAREEGGMWSKDVCTGGEAEGIQQASPKSALEDGNAKMSMPSVSVSTKMNGWSQETDEQIET